ncbi:MAG: hypothetical protein HOH74_02150 [Gemmatimonadetes bacterium]|jgi:hypothetical protein|nr:hypothetical protein [Gemmatimonadota bacterium]
MQRVRGFSMALLLAVLSVSAQAEAQTAVQTADPARPGVHVMPAGSVFNIVDWDGGMLPPLYERSDQLPLSLDDIIQMQQADFSDAAISKMLQERRCACDASVASLIRLKEAGVSEGVIQSMSLHALAPNRAIDLLMHLDFEGLGGAGNVSTQSRKSYLYLIIPDGDRDRVFFGNLQQAMGRSAKPQVDNTDLLLPKSVRRATFVARVPLRTHGSKRAMVFASTRPDIYTVADIPEADRSAAQEFTFDYPASSLQSRCSLQALHRQDAMLPGLWHLERSHFECEWD